MQKQRNPDVDFGFHASIPRIVRTCYKNLTPVQKWLYVCLKDLCGDHGTCYRSLRVLSEETGISTGMLSESIPLLHHEGLIHAEKKRRTSGGKEVWHITIVDIWKANGISHPTKRSHSEQTSENVHTVNENVHTVNDDALVCSHSERECSLCETEVRTDKQEQNEVITVKEDDADRVSPLPAISSSSQNEKPHQAPLIADNKKSSKVPQASPEAQHIIERWIAANGGKPIPMTKSLVEAAEALVDCNPSKETLICVKNFAWLNDSNGWYKKHGGVKLGDIVREYEGWQNSQNQAQVTPPAQPPQPLHRTNLSASNREMAARYAAKKG